MTDSPKKEIRVRFAPSPTGPLHIGGVRTTLFNWLFAKNQGGKFILRIEDTDILRSEKKYEKDIIGGLTWVGLNWDEGPASFSPGEKDYIGDYGPYRQSERLGIYEKYLRQLLDENKGYWCFCSKELLELDRQAMLAQGLAPKYSGRCRSLKSEEVEKRQKNKRSAVIRFKTPEVEVEFNDIIRGRVKFDASLMGDIVIAKSLKEPLYNFSAVVDDALMKISHVIRGEEHLSNTPKQILIQKALGFKDIKYAHAPLILAPDRSKLSKRQLETSLDDCRKEGYLPDALINFLALLGWHPVDDREILSRDELIKKFDLKRVQKAGAVFNIDKLEWLNAQYIKMMSSADLVKYLKDFIPGKWLKNKEFLSKIIDLERGRIKKLTDFKEFADFFFELPAYEAELLFWPRPVLKGTPPIGDTSKIKTNLKLLTEEINKVLKADFNKINLEKAVMPLAEVWGRGELLWPLRVALSGKVASPGPFEIMEILGKNVTLKRLKIALNKLK